MGLALGRGSQLLGFGLSRELLSAVSKLPLRGEKLVAQKGSQLVK